MIDVEKYVFDVAYNAVATLNITGLTMTSIYTPNPASFPHVYLEMASSAQDRASQTTDCGEERANVMFQCNVYSNKRSGAKTQAKQIAGAVSDALSSLNLTRKMMQPIPNLADATIYQIIMRFTGQVDKNGRIGRR